MTRDWDAQRYNERFGFVAHHGRSLVDLLNVQQGEFIIDLGCGTGTLTAQLTELGATTLGLDSSAAMITAASQNYPQLHFEIGDARNFRVERRADAVLSNAALHWVLEADAVIDCIHQALLPGGRFVAEFGGQGNVGSIVHAVEQVLRQLGKSHLQHPWYWPCPENVNQLS